MYCKLKIGVKIEQKSSMKICGRYKRMNQNKGIVWKGKNERNVKAFVRIGGEGEIKPLAMVGESTKTYHSTQQ